MHQLEKLLLCPVSLENVPLGHAVLTHTNYLLPTLGLPYRWGWDLAGGKIKPHHGPQSPLSSSAPHASVLLSAHTGHPIPVLSPESLPPTHGTAVSLEGKWGAGTPIHSLTAWGCAPAWRGLCAEWSWGTGPACTRGAHIHSGWWKEVLATRACSSPASRPCAAVPWPSIAHSFCPIHHGSWASCPCPAMALPDPWFFFVFFFPSCRVDLYDQVTAVEQHF